MDGLSESGKQNSVTCLLMVVACVAWLSVKQSGKVVRAGSQRTVSGGCGIAVAVCVCPVSGGHGLLTGPYIHATLDIAKLLFPSLGN